MLETVPSEFITTPFPPIIPPDASAVRDGAPGCEVVTLPIDDLR
jgi:hypothetical protein